MSKVLKISEVNKLKEDDEFAHSLTSLELPGIEKVTWLSLIF